MLKKNSSLKELINSHPTLRLASLKAKCQFTLVHAQSHEAAEGAVAVHWAELSGPLCRSGQEGAVANQAHKPALQGESLLTERGLPCQA